MIRVLLQRASLLALVAALIAPTALAQAPQQQQSQPPPEVEASSQEINKVAELLLEIEKVQVKYQTQIRQADDSESARSLQQQMRSEINRTVEEFDGLASDRYDKIVRAAGVDDDLKQRILSRVEEKREEKEEG